MRFLLAGELQLRKRELCLLLGELRLLVEQLCLVTVDFGLVDRRIDLGKQLLGLDDRSDIDEQRLQLSGDLRAHVDEVLGLEHPGRGDRILQVPALGNRRDDTDVCGVRTRPCPPCVEAASGEQETRGKNQRRATEPAPARWCAPRWTARKSVLYGDRSFGIGGHIC